MSSSTRPLLTLRRPVRALAAALAVLIGVSLVAPATTAPAWGAAGSITSVSPDQGTTAGGTAIEIVGTGFGDSGTPVVTVGGAPATSVVRESSTVIRAVTPSGSAGAATIVVTPDGGDPITRSGAFEYRSSFSAPTITTVAPSDGSVPGGELITIGGSNLTSVTEVRFGSVSIHENSFVDRGSNGTSITVRAPQGVPGSVSVAVVTSSQVVQRDNAYTYLAPTVSAISPASGPETGGTRVTITGSGLGATGTPSVTIGGAAATAVTRISSTSIQATAPVGVVGAAPVVVRVTAVSPSIVAAGSLTYTYAAVPTAPTITAVTPNRGPVAGGETVTITGTNLSISTNVRFGDATATVQSAAPGGTSIVVVVPAGAEPGAVSVRAANAAGAATMPRGYTYAAVPTISSVSPSTIITDGGNLITVTGSGFGSSGTPTVTVGGRAASCVVRVSDTEVTAVTPSGFSGPASVSVSPDTRGGSATANAAVTYATATTTPTIATLSPSSGTSVGGTTVTITGSGFGSAMPVVRFGDVCAAAVLSHTDTSIEVVTPAGSLGASDVSVTMQTGRVVSTGGFTYVAPPTFSAVSPNWGYSTGGTSVTIVGRGFGSTPPTVTFDGIAATVTSNTDEFIYATVPPGVTGPVTVIVTPQGGTPLPKLNAFTYRAPVVDSVLPEAGPENGGTTVTIRGEGFGSGAPQVTVGGVPATGIQLQSSTRITAVVPAGTGVADIRVTPQQGTGTGTLVSGYRYVPEIRTPIITSSLPVRAPQEGGTLVTVLGEHFLGSDDEPATLALERGGVTYPLDEVTVIDEGRATFRSPALSPGVYQLRLTTNEGFALLTYALTVPSPPVIDSCDAVSPRGIFLDENPGPVRVTGTGFGDGTPLVTVGGEIATVIESTDTSVRFDVPDSLVLGSQTIVVYPSTGAGAFTISSCLTAYASMWIDPDDKTIDFGDPTPAFTYTTGGLWGPDAISSVQYIFSGASYGPTTTPPTRAGVYTISIGQVALSPGSIANYDVDRRVGTFTIIGLASDVRASMADFMYGTEAPTPNVTATGLASGDSLISTELVYSGTTRGGSGYGPSLAMPTQAGTYSVTPRNADVGANTGNYDFRYFGDTFQITPRPLTITVDDTQKVYGSADPAFTYEITSGSLVDGDVLQDLLVRDPGEDVRPANLGYRITGDADAGPNYLLSINDGRLFITPKPISVTVADAEKFYGDDDPSFTVIAQGLIGDDELELTVDRDPGEEIGFYDITVSTESPTLNYEIVETESGQLRIDPRPITVGVHDLTITYGDAETGWAPLLTSGSLAFSDTLGTVQVTLDEPAQTPRPAGEHVATATSVQIVGSNAANYAITYGTGELTIERKPVTVTVGDAEIEYLDPAAEIEVSAEGLLPQHDITSSTLRYESDTVGSSTTQPTAVGAYAVLVETVEIGEVTANYDISSEDGSLLITRRALQIAIANAEKVYGSDDPTPVVTLVGDSEGIELATDDAAAVLAAATRAPGQRVSEYAYAVDADAESNFVIEVIGATALTITPKPITVTAQAAEKVFGDTDPDFVAVSEDLVAGDELAGDLARALGEDVGGRAITQGTVDEARNPDYLITFVDGVLTITPRPITVAVTDETITYGDAVPSWRIELDEGSLVAPDALGSATVDVDPALADPARAGGYALTPSQLELSTGSISNYAVQYAEGMLTVDRRAVTVTAEGQSVGFGEPVAAVTAVAEGAHTTDALSGFVAQFRGIDGTEYGPSETPPTAAGTYAIELSDIEFGAATDDYDIEAVAGELVIAPGPISITVNDAEKVYGDDDPAFTIVSEGLGLAPADVSAIESALVRASGEDVGSYVITIDESVPLNYDVEVSTDPAAPVLTVTPRPVTVTVTDASKQFGDADPATFEYTADGLLGGDSLQGSLARESGEERGTYAITAGTLDAGSNYALQPVTAGIFTIATREITVTVTDDSAAYGDDLPVWQLEVTEGSLRSGDLIDSADYQLAPTADLPLPAGEYSVTPSALVFTDPDRAEDYAITYVAGTFTVTKRVVTAALVDTEKVYGESDPAFTITGGALLDGDSLTGQAARDEGEDVGEYALTRGTLDAGDNYDLTVTPGTLTITPRPLHLSADNVEKVYGEADPELTWSIESGSVVEGDDLSAVLTRAAGEDVVVGGYAISGDDEAYPNYDLTVDAGVFDITPAPVTITVDDASKQFGDLDPTFAYSATGLVGGDSLTGSPARVDDSEERGDYEIGRGTLDGGDNYSIGIDAVTPGTLTITQRSLVVGLESRSITYGDDDGTFSAVLLEGSSLAGDDELGAVTTDLTDAAGLRPAGEVTVTALSVVITNGDIADYAVDYRSSTLTIAPLAVTVTIDDASIVYGDSDPVFTVDDSALLGSDELSGEASRASGTDVGEYTIGRGTLDAGGNYDLTVTPGTLTITQRPLTITLQDGEKTYGEPDPAFTFTAPDGVELTESEREAIAALIERESGEDAGDYALGVPSTTSGNFAVTAAEGAGDLTIAPKSITVTAENAQKTYGDADPALVAVSAELVGDDVLDGVLTRAPGNDVGEYAILQGTVDSVRNPNYLVTWSAGAQLTIAARAIELTISDVEKVYGASDPAFPVTVTSGSLVEPDAISGAAVRDEGADVGEYAIRQGSLAITENYDVTVVEGELSITARELWIDIDGAAKEFGDDDPGAFTWRISDGTLVGDDTLTGAPSRVAGEDVGEYRIGLGTLSGGANYALESEGGAFEITPRAVTVTVDDVDKVFGEPDPEFTFTITEGSLLDEADAAVVGGELGRSNDGEDVGEYTVTALPSAGANYLVTAVSGTLTITPRPVVVTPVAADKVYGADDPALTFTVDDAVDGTPLVGSLARDTGESVGTYTIGAGTVTTASNSNYTVTVTPGVVFTIEPRAIEVTVGGTEKVYGEADPETLGVVITEGELVDSDSLTGSPQRAAGEDVGDYAVTGGTLALSSNYTLSVVPGTFTVTPRALELQLGFTISAYGQPIAPAVPSVSGLQFSDEIVSLVETFDGSTVLPVDPGATERSISSIVTAPGGASNYALTVTPGTHIVTGPSAVRIDPNEGLTSGGLPFEITGSGFGTELPSVQFDGQPATEVVLHGHDRITGLTPAHEEGPVTVTVVTGAGETSLTNAYTYIAPIPGPVVLSMSPGFGTVDGGTEITITGAHLVGSDEVPAEVLIDGDPVADVRVAEDGTSLVAVTPPAPEGPRDVDIVTADGGVTFFDGFTYVPGPSGDVVGVLWFDLDGDGVRDAGEPPIPGVQIELVPDEVGPTSTRLHAATAAAAQATTDSAGEYSFTGMPYGTYRVVISLPGGARMTAGPGIGGVPETVELDGEVLALAIGVAGDESASIVITDTTGSPIPGAEVTATWAAGDGECGTSDDVSFTVTANAAGVVTLEGVPAGRWCFTATAAGWSEGEGVLELGGESTGQVTIVLTAAPGLAFTGADTGSLLAIAIALLLGGALAFGTTRRRRSTSIG